MFRLLKALQSDFRECPCEQVFELRPREPRFGPVRLPAVEDDPELEEPERAEELEAVERPTGDSFVELDERVLTHGTERHRPPEMG